MNVGDMVVKKINDWISFFYIEAEGSNYGSVVLHKGKRGIVFDTMECVANGNLERYDQGGYDKNLIENTINYLTKIISNSNEPIFLEGNMEEYITQAVEPRESYRGIHQDNLAIVQQYYKGKNLN